jgi:hypothetical protein
MYPPVPVREDTIPGAGLHFTLAKVTVRYPGDFTRAGLSLSREIPGTVSLSSIAAGSPSSTKPDAWLKGLFVEGETLLSAGLTVNGRVSANRVLSVLPV